MSEEGRENGSGLDRRRKNAEIALTTERSSQEALEKKHDDVVSQELLNLGYIQKLETDVEELVA